MIRLSTYIEIITNLHRLQSSLHKPFKFDIGKNWAQTVTCKPIAIKAADIVVHDRMYK